MPQCPLSEQTHYRNQLPHVPLLNNAAHHERVRFNDFLDQIFLLSAKDQDRIPGALVSEPSRKQKRPRHHAPGSVVDVWGTNVTSERHIVGIDAADRKSGHGGPRILGWRPVTGHDASVQRSDAEPPGVGHPKDATFAPTLRDGVPVLLAEAAKASGITGLSKI